eukprot:14550924-Alexandrium_andersonii.AAC.1
MCIRDRGGAVAGRLAGRASRGAPGHAAPTLGGRRYCSGPHWAAGPHGSTPVRGHHPARWRQGPPGALTHRPVGSGA